MQREDFVKNMETKLQDMGRSLDEMRGKAGQEHHGLLDDLKARRDGLMQKLGDLRQDSSDRWDVIKMGVESAWEELKTAFETATSKDLQKGKSDKAA